MSTVSIGDFRNKYSCFIAGAELIGSRSQSFSALLREWILRDWAVKKIV
ncbi:MAG: hypothetical protein PF589_08315 [Gammaproteobacteria bacterium]|nr:hypothetical protein [Gammaproteobacteria bacterium]